MFTKSNNKSMASDLYDIDSYNDEQLLLVLGLGTSPSVADVQSAVASQIAANRSRGNEDGVQFLEKAGARIISLIRGLDAEGNDTERGDSDRWLATAAINQPNENQSSRYVDHGAVDVVTTDGHPVLSRQRLGVSQNVSVPVVQGTLNPNLSTTNSRTLNIDSSKRRNVLPYRDDDPNYYTSPTNYYIDLPVTLTNVLGYTLNSVVIPYSFCPFDSSRGNNYFWWGDIDATMSGIKLENIDNGAYSPEAMVEAINNIFGTMGMIDASFNSTSRKFGLRDTSNNIVAQKVIFYDLLGQYPLPVDNSFCSPPLKLDTCLGWLLGFRPAENISAEYPTFSIELPLGGGGPGTPGPYVWGQAQVNLNPAPYICMILDDGNYNYVNNSQINAVDTIPLRLPPPVASADASYVCVPDCPPPAPLDCPLVKRYIPSDPRQLTNSQIYALNAKERTSRSSSIDPRATGANLPNTFATFAYDTAGLTFGSNLNITEGQNAERQFFGPVRISRFNIRLVDNQGHTINLHGLDWSFQLSVNQLYQY